MRVGMGARGESGEGVGCELGKKGSPASIVRVGMDRCFGEDERVVCVPWGLRPGRVVHRGRGGCCLGMQGG